MLYPLRFRPMFHERIWGGRKLETLYRKPLPPELPIGESWEISDRPGAQSEIINGNLAGKTLRWLMQHHGREVLGEAADLNGRFPLLVKILDAREKLSLQVHPPPGKAKLLRGEPKTEMWYITDAEPGAELFVGLRKGVTKDQFTAAVQNGSVADCFHRVEVNRGDSMFLPSGRVHAIGGGLCIFEIQQNSDTTYRVFDWNRVDAGGKPRQLHVSESLESINFEDFEPEPIRADIEAPEGANMHIQTLVEDSLFTVEVVSVLPPGHIDYSLRSARVLGVIEGEVKVLHENQTETLGAGEFCLLPAAMHRAKIEADTQARFLVATPG